MKILFHFFLLYINFINAYAGVYLSVNGICEQQKNLVENTMTFETVYRCLLRLNDIELNSFTDICSLSFQFFYLIFFSNLIFSCL